MFNFIKIQFDIGNITAEKVRSYVPRFITQQQADEIIGGKEVK